MSSNLKVNFLKLVTLMLFVLALISCGGGGSDDDQADGDLERDSTSDGDADKDTSDADQVDGDKDLETEPDKDSDVEDDEDLEDGDEEPDSEEDSALAGSALEVTPAPAVFDEVEVGSSGQVEITLANVPKASNEGATLTVSYMLFTASSLDSLAVDSTCTPPFEIEAGDSVTCNLSCTPEEPGKKEGILRIVAADGISDPAEYLIDVSCPVLHPISFGDPAIVEFGFNPKGVRQEQSFSIANAGAMNLEITSIDLSDDTPESFSISASGIRLDSDTIQANELIEIEIAYQPDRSTNEIGWLEIESDDPYVPLRVIPITGRTGFMCPQDAPNLEGSSCIDQCVPRLRRCVMGDEAMPDKVEICLEDGSGFEELEECGDGLFCYGGYCVAQVCDAEAVMCHDGSAQSCMQDGSGFEEAVSCGEGDECTVSTCTPGSGCGSLDISGRCEDDNPCTDDSCDTGSGCINAFNQNSCDDDNPCTVNDACSFGQCRGAFLDCDDDNSCTADTCNPESELADPCLHENVESDCNDNSACTTDDHCDEGQCVGNYIVCDDSNFCTEDNCQPDSGCVYQFNSDTCNDSNACTENDRCQSGVCRGDTLNPDDGEFCNGEESCDPLSGLLMGFVPTCNDGLACTVDSCDSELDSCKNTLDDNLCNDNNPCTIDTCEIGIGCVFNQVEEMTPCNFQGNVDEYCVGGLCTFACADHDDCYDGIPCTEDNCDSYTGFCQNIPHDEWCFNASLCDGNEICSSVTGCAMGTEPLCDDGIACTFDTCNEIDGGCTNEPVNYLCNDNNPCTLDLCMPGDGCENIPIDVVCDDGNPCTLNDHCFNGTCISGLENVDCDDGNPCSTDTCDGQGECLHSYNAETCDDGDPCTLDDLCFNGSCIGNNSSCDDGTFCNGAESCNDEGGCIEGLIPPCDDGVACTVDTCENDIDQCAQTPDDALCDDGSECTIEYCDPLDGCMVEQILDGTPCGDADMYCYQGLCVDTCGENSDCDDNVYCTIDECDSEMGLCIHTANDSVCQNDYVCDGQEICHLTFDCIDGEVPSCDDGLECTEDTCEEEGRGCVNTPDTLACDDGNPCTEDVCSAQTDPLSNPSGCFNSSLSNGACDDGDPCTSNEHCMAGVCIGDETNCDDGNPCTANYCDESGVCRSEEFANGSSCGSSTAERICLNGQCITGCTNDSDCKGSDEVACTLDYCDPNTFQCQHMAYDQFCDDGLFCNGSEYCDETLGCQAGVALDCDDQVDCTYDYCDEDSMDCRHPTDDSLCDTLDPCTEGYCTSNGCLYGNTNYDCNDGNPCTTDDRCTEGVCEGEALECDDDNQCTEDACVDFVGCVYTDISTSCDDQNPCTDDFCLPANGCGFKSYQTKACDDGNQCTTGDWCKAGQCVPGPALLCNDFNPCTNDSCVTGEGCQNEYVGDGLPCDITLDSYDEYCSGGQCVLVCTVDEDCNDHIDCTSDVCSGGFCQYATSDAACDDEVFCNGSETCAINYGCMAGDVPTCNDDNECTADFCDGVLDQCSSQSMNSACDDGNSCTLDSCGPTGCEHDNLDAVECSDGNFCTVDDICIDGICQGNIKSCDDLNDCTGPDSCDAKSGCVNPPAENGTLCAEDSASCMGGACTRLCEYDAQCDDGVDCTKDYCNLDTLICTYETDDSVCDDGLFCNGAETCHVTLGCQLPDDLPCRDDFACTEDSCDEELDECSYQTYDERCDDFNPCTEDTCSELVGCSYALRTGQQCEDENPCTTTSICDEVGHCVADTLTDCGSTPSTCRRIECDPVKGCMEILADDFSGCEGMIDGCSDMAHCINGQCVGNGNYYCNDNNACTLEYCDEECTYYANNDTNIVCSDNERCTVDDGCMLGNCTGIEADCDDGNPCTDDSCSEEQGCEHMPAIEGQACSIDSLTGSCHNGICAKDCTGDGECDDGIACTTDTCKQPEGYCQYELDNATCDDGLYCNGEEICIAHVGCVDNIPIDCSDGLECTMDIGDEGANQCTHSADHTVCELGDTCATETCDLELGCIQEKLSGPACENDNPCFGDGYCHEGLCVGEPTDCDDDNPCTADTCNPFSGGCESVELDGIDCNDGKACTVKDTCSAGTCSGTDASCDDYNPCTYDYCDPVDGCVHVDQTGVPCNDNDQCTTQDYCFEGQCMGFERLLCNDEDPCTKDSCQPDEGCVFVPDEGAPCEDGNACTVGDKCHIGTCRSGSELNCNDNNPCTGPDSCDTQSGCNNPAYPDETSCDLNPLYAEACISGLCVSYCTSDIQCNDGVGCTQNVCDIETHTCGYNPVDSLCSDGLYCNGQEICDQEFGCRAGLEIICDDDINCTDDICNESDDTCLFVPQDFICNDYDHCTTDTCDLQSGCINTPVTGNGCDPE